MAQWQSERVHLRWQLRHLPLGCSNRHAVHSPIHLYLEHFVVVELVFIDCEHGDQ